MKAIVFGGSGFLGQYIVQELLSRKYKVTIFDRSYPKNKYLKNLNFIKGDIQNKEKVVNAIKGKSIVYNFAGISDIGDAMINPIKTSKINLIGERFPAIELKNGRLGCSMSHLRCIEMAKERGWDHVFICEDDITFTRATP